MSRSTIECQDCDWAFDNVYVGDIMRDIIYLHEHIYSHTVQVTK